ncbi:Phage gp6-like head-tail connector protein [Caloramator quimbayensis]|uniref:Phage gp6-like head-tail connector protein n=1 Tax=Caloramator quimbayensis TaxID=1147123 RepID=A0A1T4YC62_9CLOT|nr:head-tail connector protein [Caloramator quimbayensis]SKA99359.1 Phage gp6-like head-tail connector protein [Caloramator quimbayensis]
MLEEIKCILGIAGTSTDAYLNFQINKAQEAIKNYLHVEDVSSYDLAIKEYVIVMYNRRGNEGVKQAQQGSRIATFGDDLPESVKNLLPLPKIKMIG